MIDNGTCDHEPRIDGASDYSTQGIPSSIIKPIVKGIETLIGQIFRCSVIEVGIKFVYHAFIAEHGEQSY